MKKLIFICMTANLIEWYEFIITAYLSTSMGHVFFNNHNQTDLLATVQIFSIFALSYLIRPIGCIILGWFGNIYGSGRTIRISLLLMAIPTFIIGILPGYNQIGIMSTGIFILLRLTQGIAAGGELPIMSIYVFDNNLKNKNSNLLCALINTSGMIGMLLASATLTILNAIFNQDQITTYAWRIPFLLGLPLALIIFYIRNFIVEQNAAENCILAIKGFAVLSIIKATALIVFLQINMYVFLYGFLHI